MVTKKVVQFLDLCRKILGTKEIGGYIAAKVVIQFRRASFAVAISGI